MSEQRLKTEVRLGLNIIDLGRMSEYVRAKAVKTGLPDLSRPITYAEGDERLVELRCPLLTAAMLVDFVRNEGRVERSTICRAYMKKGDGGWVKLPLNAVLSVEVKGSKGLKYELSEEWFPVEVEAVPYDPGTTQRVLFRKRK